MIFHHCYGRELLDLSENQLTTINNISHLRELAVLRLADNHIESLLGLDGLGRLRELDLSNNSIKAGRDAARRVDASLRLADSRRFEYMVL